MARIKICDLPKDKKLTQEEARQITGGARVVEYVSVLPLISVAVVSSVTSLGERFKSKLAAVKKSVEDAGSGGDRED